MLCICSFVLRHFTFHNFRLWRSSSSSDADSSEESQERKVSISHKEPAITRRGKETGARSETDSARKDPSRSKKAEGDGSRSPVRKQGQRSRSKTYSPELGQAKSGDREYETGSMSRLPGRTGSGRVESSESQVLLHVHMQLIVQ